MTLVHALTALVITPRHLTNLSFRQRLVDLALVDRGPRVQPDDGVLAALVLSVRVLSVEDQVHPDHADDEDADRGHDDGREDAAVLENILLRLRGFWMIDEYLLSLQLLRPVAIHQRQTLGETRPGNIGEYFLCHQIFWEGF